MENKPNLPPFDVSDSASIGKRWAKWKRSLELFLEVNCIALASRKRSCLLHYAGPEVQDIFFNIDGHDAVPPAGTYVYREAIRLLDAHFAPLSSVPYERVIFRRMTQLENENVEKFIHRLRDQGRLCEYGNALEMRITKQVFDNGNSDSLREAILKKKLMTVQEITVEGRILETVKRNREEMKKSVDETSVNVVRKPTREEICFRCGYTGHFASDKKCPAKSKACDKCTIVGHFKKMCKTKIVPKSKTSTRKGKIQQVKNAESLSSESTPDDSSEEEVQHVYAAGSVSEKVTCFVGGVKLDWVIDSGAHVNVINRVTWKWLKKQGCIVSRQEKSNKTLRVYGDGKLEVYKVIKADIATRNKTVHHEIYVVNNHKRTNLLSRGTSIDLGVLEIHAEVFNVAEPNEPPIGKLKAVQVQIKTDDRIPPVQQACRR
ncbi:uncharacterized protein LOC131688402 [Topomyia yanbarensis]|uniref:uncharacterized protein LOC131688402 n=1 Tax=Topomyia yanbarensis TaxID=2498891 RepID=UPI00273AC0A4|nr:uncharacterized protein LOC131688402 [Topomyia yanbarensis]